MPYKFFSDMAIADVAFEATGKTLEEMFESAALAVTDTMVKDLKSVRHKNRKKILVKDEKIDMLLFKFLQRLVYYKDAERLLFSKFSIKIKRKPLQISCVAEGEKLDMKRHDLTVDVKGVTLHNFEAEETRSGWRAQVVLDI